jgi:hypothetical protein
MFAQRCKCLPVWARAGQIAHKDAHACMGMCGQIAHVRFGACWLCTACPHMLAWARADVFAQDAHVDVDTCALGAHAESDTCKLSRRHVRRSNTPRQHSVWTANMGK